MPVSITQVTVDDCQKMAAFAAETFIDTFGHLYTPENLAAHLAKTCSANYMRAALQAGDSLLWMREAEAIIGYAKFGHIGLPLPQSAALNACEIHRLYIASSYQGRGLGRYFMQHMLDLSVMRAAPEIYLGVWEENTPAQKLYAQFGFNPIGHYFYSVGTQQDREIIMRRAGDAKTASPPPAAR